MLMYATYKKHTLQFIHPAGTSRGVYTSKDSWIISLCLNGITGIGECSLLKGLSIDDRPDFEAKLQEVCDQINAGTFDFNDPLHDFPAIRFGLETAYDDLQTGGKHILFDTAFSRGQSGIVTNGLIWMGSESYMQQQIIDKLQQGFTCIKLKIGSLNWTTERALIANMRKQFSPEQLSIRVDANGAYNPRQAEAVLDDLAKLNVHSIEQPIKSQQWDEMLRLCQNAPLPIALDEELIGIFPKSKRRELLETIKPHYIIIKPGLLGGFESSDEWIALAESMGIGWWATSALESNIGLNAIAQWVSSKENTMPQGLGTGALFSNNIVSPLNMQGEKLFYDSSKSWQETF